VLVHGEGPISPSGVACYGQGELHIFNQALSLSEIEEIRDLFTAAAVRAKELECDGVVIHGATSYLLQQWYPANEQEDRQIWWQFRESYTASARDHTRDSTKMWSILSHRLFIAHRRTST